MLKKIYSKISNWFMAKAIKNKNRPLYMVPKKVLFNRIYELNNYVDQLELKNEMLNTSNREFKNTSNKQTSKYTSKDKTNEQDKPIKAELAYQGLLIKYEKLQEENKSMKDSIELVSGVIDNTEKQNDLLKENNRMLYAQKESLQDTVNMFYKRAEQKEDIQIRHKPVNKNINKVAKIAR